MINSRLKVTRKIGEGRSSVYHCIDLKTNDNYALKVLPPSLTKEEYDKFSGEYHVIQKLNHPGIIKAYDLGTVLEAEYEDILVGSRFLVLELFNGIELSDVRNISNAQLKEVIIQIASVLQYLHLSNYIYYDLKPENILVNLESGNTVIKIIDFGFAQLKNEFSDDITRGTAEYIAPELLRKEPYDHRVDYYSLGILLYKVIYGEFPFDNSNELKVFRAQLEDNFVFSPNRFSPGINKVMQKLLSKDPKSRYLNSMQIYRDLEYLPGQDILSSWIPAKVFTDRKDSVNILNNYLRNYSDGEVFILKGSEDSGKSTVLREFYEKIPGAILIEGGGEKNGVEFIKSFTEKILYNESIHTAINEGLKKRIKNFLEESKFSFIEEAKGIFFQLSRSCRFILLLDDFNSMDELSLHLFKEIIPFFQVNNIKLIISEDNEKPCYTDFIKNQLHINLSPFTDSQVEELLDKSLYNYYPKDELKKLILSHADLLPGSIVSFIKDLVLFGIIKFTADDIRVVSDSKSIEILKHSHEYFYKLRVTGLNREELLVSEYLSAFKIIPDRGLLSVLLYKYNINLEAVLNSLKTKNVLHVSGNFSKIVFTSEGLKKYVYNQIKNKKELHSRIASALETYPPQNRNEIAFQYEMGEDYNKSVHYYNELYLDSALVDAYSYQKKLLEHILTLPLIQEQKNRFNVELCNILLKSGEPAAALENCDQLLIKISDVDILNELLLIKGICLIRLGFFKEGIKEIESLVDILEDEPRKRMLKSEIASAYLDLNNFSEAESICRSILECKTESGELTGKCYNLLGLIAIHRDNDIDKAYGYFQSAESIYNSAGLKFRTAQMQMNLGNIRNMKEESEEAERLWTSSIELNSSIGNLQHEATLLLNLGVLYSEKLDYEKSLLNYKKALSIFSSTGDLKGEGLVNYNMGEIYYHSSDYGNAYSCLNKSRLIFQKLQDTNEELETLFILGKFYFTIGSTEDLKEILNEFENMLNRVTGDKHLYNYRYLKLLFNQENLNFFHELKDIILYYSRQGDKNNFFRATMTAVRFLYEHQLYTEALEEINKNDFVLAAQSNIQNYAEWNLYFGLITAHSGDNDFSPNEYYLKALNLIEDFTISELTWEIMIVLAEFYYRRGNILRAEEFSYYTKSLLEHISDGIRDERLCNLYLNKKEVKNALLLSRKILLANG